MPSEREKSKRWQFGLLGLLLTTTFLPIVIGLAGGAFGATIQHAFLFVLAIFLWIVFLMLSAGGLMFVIANGAFYFAKLVDRDSDDEPASLAVRVAVDISLIRRRLHFTVLSDDDTRYP